MSDDDQKWDHEPTAGELHLTGTDEHDSSKEEVEITTSPRGFHIYGEPWRDDHGNVVSVYESSAATGPHVWINVDWMNSAVQNHETSVSTHLSEKMARRLHAQLGAFLDEIPERWGE